LLLLLYIIWIFSKRKKKCGGELRGTAGESDAFEEQAEIHTLGVGAEFATLQMVALDPKSQGRLRLDIVDRHLGSVFPLQTVDNFAEGF